MTDRLHRTRGLHSLVSYKAAGQSNRPFSLINHIPELSQSSLPLQTIVTHEFNTDPISPPTPNILSGHFSQILRLQDNPQGDSIAIFLNHLEFCNAPDSVQQILNVMSGISIFTDAHDVV